jgi:hypothetical protein
MKGTIMQTIDALRRQLDTASHLSGRPTAASDTTPLVTLWKEVQGKNSTGLDSQNHPGLG